MIIQLSFNFCTTYSTVHLDKHSHIICGFPFLPVKWCFFIRIKFLNCPQIFSFTNNFFHSFLNHFDVNWIFTKDNKHTERPQGWGNIEPIRHIRHIQYICTVFWRRKTSLRTTKKVSSSP